MLRSFALGGLAIGLGPAANVDRLQNLLPGRLAALDLAVQGVFILPTHSPKLNPEEHIGAKR
jgi:hypothetical protein